MSEPAHPLAPSESPSTVEKPNAASTAREVRDVLAPIMSRVPRYVVLGARLLREPEIRWQHKSLLAVAILWWSLPLHYAVNLIPVVGWIDVPALFLLGMRQALGNCPPHVAQRHLKRVGLTPTQAQEDLGALLQLSLSVAGQIGSHVGARLKQAGSAAGELGRRVGGGAAGVPTESAAEAPAGEPTDAASTVTDVAAAAEAAAPEPPSDLRIAGAVARGFGRRLGHRLYRALEELAADDRPRPPRRAAGG